MRMQPPDDAPRHLDYARPPNADEGHRPVVRWRLFVLLQWTACGLEALCTLWMLSGFGGRPVAPLAGGVFACSGIIALAAVPLSVLLVKGYASKYGKTFATIHVIYLLLLVNALFEYSSSRPPSRHIGP